MTNFEKAYKDAQEGKSKVPTVSSIRDDGESKIIDYFNYQLAIHKFNLGLMTKGLKSRGVKLKDLKDYYGLKGRSAKDCYPHFLVIFYNHTGLAITQEDRELIENSGYKIEYL